MWCGSFIRRSCVCGGILIAAVSSGFSFGALSVKNDDVADNHYVYKLTYQDLGSTKWETDVESRKNVMRVLEEKSRYVKAETDQTEAGFTYVFDFSASDYRPSKMEIFDALVLFTYIGSENGEQKVEAITSYSTDGEHFTEIRRVSTAATSELCNMSRGNSSFVIKGAPAKVYYRVTFKALKGDVFRGDQNQWARCSERDPALQINFTVMKAAPAK